MTQKLEDRNKDFETETITKLAQELISISKIKKEKYPFRKEYLGKLIGKWKATSGKYIVDLEDLPSNCIVKFNDEGKNILKNLLNFVKEKYGLDRVNRKYGINFYLVRDSISRREGGLTVGAIRKYLKFSLDNKLTIFDIDVLKRNIIEIKTSTKSKAIKVNGLPIDLRDEKWAPIFGIILDSYLKKFKFVAEDREFADYVKSAFSDVGIDPYFKEERGNLIGIKGHSVISHIINIAGIETNKKQLMANNCLPLWMFSCSGKYHAILLSKFLDTEGYVPKGRAGIRIAQASFIDLTKDEKEFVLSNCKNTIIKPSNKESKVIIFTKLNDGLKEKALSNPSLILLSTQLLLRMYGINSKIYPVNIYISSNGKAAVSWHLAIIGFSEIRKFYELCSNYISIKYKKDNIQKILEKQKAKCLPMGLRILNFLVHAYHIEKDKGYFTSKDLMNLIKRNVKSVNNDIGHIAAKNLIKTISIEDHLKFWVLTEKGRNHLKDHLGLDKQTWNNLIAT